MIEKTGTAVAADAAPTSAVKRSGWDDVASCGAVSDQLKAVPAKLANHCSCCGDWWRLELEVEVRPGCVTGGADEADRLACGHQTPGDDRRLEIREMAVRPGLPVEGLHGQADPATRIRVRPGAEDDPVGEGVERRAGGRGDVDGGVIVVGVEAETTPGPPPTGKT